MYDCTYFYKEYVYTGRRYERTNRELWTSSYVSRVLDGYLTMDALVALIFGIVIANALRAKGIEDDKSLAKYMSIAGIVAGLLLSIIYVILGYVGQLVAH